MAMTSLSYLYKLKSEEIGYTVTEHKKVFATQTLPMYIPRLMPEIKSGEPSEIPVTGLGSMIFLNAPEVRPIAVQTLITQNYLSPKFERNKSFGSDQLTEDNTIPRKTKLEVHCKTNVITQMTFSNDIIE